MMMKVAISQAEGGPGTARMTIESTFPSREAMEKVLEMGAEEGMSLAIGQIDAMVAGDGA
jgi:hypothetical protein